MTAEPTPSPRTSRSIQMKLLLYLVAPLFILIVLALMAHAIWRGKERAKADTWVATIRAAGEPMAIEDLVESPVPDAQNIVVLFRQAHAAMVRNQALQDSERELNGDDDHAFTSPLTDAETALLRDKVAANAKALSILSGLSERDGVQWDSPLTSPMMYSLMPELNDLRRTSLLLNDAARLAMHDRRHADALDHMLDVMPLAKACGRRPMLVGYLVSTGMDGMIADRIIELAPELDVADAGVRERAALLIAELLNDQAATDAVRQGVVSERLAIHDSIRAVTTRKVGFGALATATPPPPLNPLATYAMAPMLYRSDALMLESLTVAAEAVDATSLLAFNARATRMLELEAELMRGSFINAFGQLLVPSMGRAIEASYRTRTERHLAATVLAIRLYQHDHAGVRPTTLAELVPKYLPAVPLDAIDGQPLRYDSERAIVWSVGVDRSDNAGDATASRPRFANRWHMRDAVVFLNRQPRPATQPSAN